MLDRIQDQVTLNWWLYEFQM